MELLLFSIIFFIGIVLISTLSPRPVYRRQKTAREDALHNQIQRAMNWQPGFPPDDAEWNENNEWTDPDSGKVWKRMTLNELLKKESNDSKI